jgi:predicted lipid-binding transport protein (Tim44 family)
LNENFKIELLLPKMKISWTSLKISIAGAKLSHLVQKDKIWDHGSMVEQVRNIFYLVDRARNKNEIETETIRKCLTANAFEKFKAQMERTEKNKSFFKNAVITEIAIVRVTPAKKQVPDSFRATIKGKRKTSEDIIPIEGTNYGIENFSEEWFFTRQGEWWLLDGMKSTRSFFRDLNYLFIKIFL